MSYHTNFNLELHIVPENIQDTSRIIQDFRNRCDYAKRAFDNSGCENEEVTWYHYEEDMKDFSRSYPTIVFRLIGVGDATDDQWYKYFRNGKMQKCYVRFMFDPYDPAELE